MNVVAMCVVLGLGHWSVPSKHGAFFCSRIILIAKGGAIFNPLTNGGSDLKDGWSHGLFFLGGGPGKLAWLNVAGASC